jgi:hypothetical protein
MTLLPPEPPAEALGLSSPEDSELVEQALVAAGAATSIPPAAGVYRRRDAVRKATGLVMAILLAQC